jgi:tyrosyl-tRNA synthetase
MKIDTNKEKIEEILTRSVAEILPTKNALRDALQSGKRLRVYIGTDATGTSLHLGHATNYMILEKLRKLGHEVIFLVGDFTARMGDPTDKNDSARKQLSRREVIKNVQTWVDQIKPVIDTNNKENPVKILYNNDWLSALTFENVLNLAANFTVQQMIERDMFQERIKSEKPLYLHELFYPLMQGYDSVAMDVDVELCGMDQKFNALAGRTLLKKLKGKEKFVFITTLLENPKTGEKMMSKSIGTGVFLDFGAEKMYGALMSQPDGNMQQLFVDCTWLTLKEIKQILETKNPRDAKMRLAFEITKIYHGEGVAQTSEKNFVQTFQNKKLPNEMPEVEVSRGALLVDVLIDEEVIDSKGEFRRLLSEGAIRKDGEEKLIDPMMKMREDVVLKIGKHRFIKITVKK